MDNQFLKCANCGWEGKGSDVTVIDFYGVSKVKEIHCPKCDEKLGEIQDAGNTKNDTDDQLSNQLG